MRLLRGLKNWLMYKSHPLIPGPGIVAALLFFEVIYWSSPNWAQKVGWPTWEDSKASKIASCERLLVQTCVSSVVHDGGLPIPPEALPEWTPIRVERRFASGFTVVSALGPHANFQYLVRDLALPVGTVFRRFQGRIISS